MRHLPRVGVVVVEAGRVDQREAMEVSGLAVSRGRGVQEHAENCLLRQLIRQGKVAAGRLQVVRFVDQDDIPRGLCESLADLDAEWTDK